MMPESMPMPRSSAFKVYAVIMSSSTRGGMYLSGLAILIMALFVTFEVVARTLLGFSTLVADEWPSYLLVFATFLGLAYTMESKGFLQVEFFLRKLSKRNNQILHSLLLFLALMYSVLLDYYLISHTLASYSRGIVSISLSKTPLYIPQLFMPIGMTIFVLELIKECICSFFDLFASNAPYSPRENHK
jgi:TRAP-type C4-dicarboxylate transport system permease small subunit